jgi:hypothetical protein
LLTGRGFRGGASPALAVRGHPVSILGGARSGRKLVTRLTYLGLAWARLCGALRSRRQARARLAALRREDVPSVGLAYQLPLLPQEHQGIERVLTEALI